MERHYCGMIVGTVSAYGKTLFWPDLGIALAYTWVNWGKVQRPQNSWKLSPRTELGSFRIQVRCVIT